MVIETDISGCSVEDAGGYIYSQYKLSCFVRI